MEFILYPGRTRLLFTSVLGRCVDDDVKLNVLNVGLKY